MKEMIAIIIISFCVGFMSHLGLSSYIDMKEKSVVEKTIKATQKEIAKGFEQQKADLANIAKANKKQQTNIITNNKEVYSKECIDEAGLEQLKKYKRDSK